MVSRRQFIQHASAALAAAWASGRGLARAQSGHGAHGAAEEHATGTATAATAPVHRTPGGVSVPNGATLPWRLVDGVKVFHLVAEPIRHEMAPGLELDLWGYNGRTPGPVIEAREGERVRIFVSNRLPAPTTVHWHGVELPNGMDGVAGLNQPPIAPGETFRYEFRFSRPGTFMYHPHFDELVQIGMGLMGMIVVHARQPDHVERDFALMLAEWSVPAGMRRPDTMEMSDFNLATINSKVFPATEPLVVRRGQRVRIRFGNLSITNHHPLHLHGHHFEVSGTEGGVVPRTARLPESTVLVPNGAVREIEFVASAPGDWALHCHMLHHIMNQMGHAGPNMVGVNARALDEAIGPLMPGFMTMGAHGMVGVDHPAMPVPPNAIPMKTAPGPFGRIDMGGMFTVVKVREAIDTYGDPGWYAHPGDTVARVALAEELARDGIAQPAPIRSAPTEAIPPEHEPGGHGGHGEHP